MTWDQRVAAGLTATIIGALAVHPTNSGVAYAGSPIPPVPGGHGLFKTTDAGLSWNPASTGIPADAQILALALDTANPDTVIYAGTFGGVYKSIRGSNWAASNDGNLTADMSVQAILIDWGNPPGFFRHHHLRGDGDGRGLREHERRR